MSPSICTASAKRPFLRFSYSVVWNSHTCQETSQQQIRVRFSRTSLYPASLSPLLHTPTAAMTSAHDHHHTDPELNYISHRDYDKVTNRCSGSQLNPSWPRSIRCSASRRSSVSRRQQCERSLFPTSKTHPPSQTARARKVRPTELATSLKGSTRLIRSSIPFHMPSTERCSFI